MVQVVVHQGERSSLLFLEEAVHQGKVIMVVIKQVSQPLVAVEEEKAVLEGTVQVIGHIAQPSVDQVVQAPLLEMQTIMEQLVLAVAVAVVCLM